MSPHLLLLVWTGAAGAFIESADLYRTESVLGKPSRRVVPWMAFLLFIPVIWLATQRGYFADTGAYLRSFADMPLAFSGVSDYMSTVTKDPGFYLLSCVIRILSGGSTLIYLLTIALLQGGILVWVYRKYTPHFSMAIFLFLASTDYVSWMFNGIRQFCAVVIVFAATGLLLKKKYIPLICVILLASTMHQSALMMIPLVFIARGKAWNSRTVLFLILALTAVLFVDQFTDILDNAMQETQYENMVTDWTEWEDDGTNPLRVLVYSVPAILSLVGLRYIRQANDPLIDICVNMSIFSSGLYIVSMFTSGIFIGRLPIYTSLFSYILLPWEIEHMFTKDSARIVKMCMIGAYLVFYIYQMHFIYGIF